MMWSVRVDSRVVPTQFQNRTPEMLHSTRITSLVAKERSVLACALSGREGNYVYVGKI
jgi:hypothetical protein